MQSPFQKTTQPLGNAVESKLSDNLHFVSGNPICAVCTRPCLLFPRSHMITFMVILRRYVRLIRPSYVVLKVTAVILDCY